MKSNKQGAVSLVGGQTGERGAVFEKKRNVADVADEKIVYNSMRIVKMKRVVKMVGVNDNQSAKKNKGSNKQKRFACSGFIFFLQRCCQNNTIILFVLQLLSI